MKKEKGRLKTLKDVHGHVKDVQYLSISPLSVEEKSDIKNEDCTNRLCDRNCLVSCRHSVSARKSSDPTFKYSKNRTLSVHFSPLDQFNIPEIVLKFSGCTKNITFSNVLFQYREKLAKLSIPAEQKFLDLIYMESGELLKLLVVFVQPNDFDFVSESLCTILSYVDPSKLERVLSVVLTHEIKNSIVKGRKRTPWSVETDGEPLYFCESFFLRLAVHQTRIFAFDFLILLFNKLRASVGVSTQGDSRLTVKHCQELLSIFEDCVKEILEKKKTPWILQMILLVIHKNIPRDDQNNYASESFLFRHYWTYILANFRDVLDVLAPDLYVKEKKGQSYKTMQEADSAYKISLEKTKLATQDIFLLSDILRDVSDQEYEKPAGIQKKKNLATAGAGGLPMKETGKIEVDALNFATENEIFEQLALKYEIWRSIRKILRLLTCRVEKQFRLQKLPEFKQTRNNESEMVKARKKKYRHTIYALNNYLNTNLVSLTRSIQVNGLCFDATGMTDSFLATVRNAIQGLLPDYHSFLCKIASVDYYIVSPSNIELHSLASKWRVRKYSFQVTDKHPSDKIFLDFVTKSYAEDDFCFRLQLMKLLGRTLEWDFDNFELSFLRKEYFKAVSLRPHRKWPCVSAKFTTASIPPYLGDVLLCTIVFESGNFSKTMKLSISITNFDLMNKLARKLKNEFLGALPINNNNFLFKICGYNQYLFEEVPLQYLLHVRECLKRRKRIVFSLVPREKLIRELHGFEGKSFFSKSVDSIPFFEEGKSSMDQTDNLQVKIHDVDQLEVFLNNYETDTPVDDFNALFSVEANILFGGQSVSPPKVTQLVSMRDFKWNKSLHFDLPICMIPREAIVMFKLCIVDKPTSTQTKDTRVRSSQCIAWSSIPIFDFCGYLVNGSYEISMILGDLPPSSGYYVDSFQSESFVLRLSFPSGIPVFFPRDIANLKDSKLGSGRIVSCIPTEDVALQLNRVVYSNALYSLTDEDKLLLWKYRRYLISNPKALVRVLQSVVWADWKMVADVHRLLSEWHRLSPLEALELLSVRNADTFVRSYAVECLDSFSFSEISEYLIQIVQALEYEPFADSKLASFLLHRALENRVEIGHNFFWLLKTATEHSPLRDRFACMLECYLRGSGEHRNILCQQQQFVHDLRDARNKVSSKNTPFTKIISDVKIPKNFLLPIDPTIEVKEFYAEKCRVIDSFRLPLWLVFENADPLGEPVTIIFKTDEDIRQDMLTLQLLSFMDKLWRCAGTDLGITTYKCLALGADQGMIEVVLDSETTANIQKAAGVVTGAFKEDPLYLWLRTHNAPNTSKAFGKNFDLVVDNFLRSCAGYCVATYVLGIGDRHNDNILLSKSGHLFHIDFGHFLGNVQKWKGFKREKAPFVLTPEYAYVMGGKNSSNFQRFVEVCRNAFLVVRRNSHVLLNLFGLMIATGLPELRSMEDMAYLVNALCLDVTSSEAENIFEKLIYESLDTVTTRINNAIHMMAHPKVSQQT